MGFEMEDYSSLGRDTIEVDWSEIDTELRGRIRLTGKTAYDILYQGKDPSELDHLRGYARPEDTGMRESMWSDNGQELTLIYSAFRPSANPYPAEDGEVFIVEGDRWVKDLRKGNDVFFQRMMEDDEEFQEDVFCTVSDAYGDELGQILGGNY